MLDIINKFPATDNGNGTYTIENLPAGEYCYMVEKEGYFSSNPTTVSIIDQNVEVDVILQKYPDSAFYDITFLVKDSVDNTISLSDVNIAITDEYDMATLPQYDQFYWFDINGLTSEENEKEVYHPLTVKPTPLLDVISSINYSFTLFAANQQPHTVSGNTMDNSSEFTLQPGDNEESFNIMISFSDIENNNGDPIEMAIIVENWIIKTIAINPDSISPNIELTDLEVKLMFISKYDQFYSFDLTGMNANNPGMSVYYPLTDTRLPDPEKGVDYFFTVYTSDGEFRDWGNTVEGGTGCYLDSEDDDADGTFWMGVNYGDPAYFEVGFYVENWVITSIETYSDAFPANFELYGLEIKLKVNV